MICIATHTQHCFKQTYFVSQVVIKAVRELGERDGSTLKSIEKYVRQSHNVVESAESDLKTCLRIAAKRAAARGLVHQEGKNFKYNYQNHSPNSKRREIAIMQKQQKTFDDICNMQPRVSQIYIFL